MCSFAAEVGLAGDPGRVVDTVGTVTWSDVDVLDREATCFRHGISTKWEEIFFGLEVAGVATRLPPGRFWR
ncbi:MAG: hypothetical protein CL505_06530 [Actinobacteria bacterium]|nr:hypothetical protein [Actinomycetota bacterium]